MFKREYFSPPSGIVVFGELDNARCVFTLDMQTGSGRYLLKPHSIQVFLHKQHLLTEKLSSQTSISFECVNLDNLAIFSGKQHCIFHGEKF